MQDKRGKEDIVEWDDVLEFLRAKRNHIEKLERGCSQRKKEFEVGL